MKRSIILFLATILSSLTFCQDLKTILGIEFTPTIASLRGDNIGDDTDARLGFSSGFSFEYLLGTHVSLKSALKLERKGAKADIQLLNSMGEGAGTDIIYYNYDYLTLPILASYSTKGKTKFYLNAGPYFGYLISQKIKSDGIGETIDNTDNTEKLDIGLSFGLGFNIPLGTRLLFDIGLQENFGLTNTNKESIINEGTIKTNSLGLQLGLKYKL